MKTKVFKVQDGHLAESDLSFCVETLRTGGLVVFPTDTVYGIGCNAFHPEAIAKVYALKGRRYSKPLPVLLSQPRQLSFVAKEIPKEAHRLIEAFWPGALTLVFKTAPLALHASRGKETIAVRIPDHGIAQQLVQQLSLPLAATSANLSGKAAFKTGAQVKKVFLSKVDVIIDGGACEVGRESSVVDATHFPFTILREGAVSKPQLLAKMGLI